jgi:hypothetical protein
MLDTLLAAIPQYNRDRTLCWDSSYGGGDNPVCRRGYEPADFKPLENPFYVALPYSEMFG